MVTLLPVCCSSDTGIQSAQAASIVCHSLCSMAIVHSLTRLYNPAESGVAGTGNRKSSSEVKVSGATSASTSWFLGTDFLPTGDTALYRDLWFSAYTASRSNAQFSSLASNIAFQLCFQRVIPSLYQFSSFWCCHESQGPGPNTHTSFIQNRVPWSYLTLCGILYLWIKYSVSPWIPKQW